ncbi:MAG: GDSL-type esterase/lipase family protein [Bacteroidaceae bacterium]
MKKNYMTKQRANYSSRLLVLAVAAILLPLVGSKAFLWAKDSVPLLAKELQNKNYNHLKIDKHPLLEDPNDTMRPFWNQLDSLQTGQNKIVTVIHLGDSHIQAGFYSGTVMRLLQEKFGNAGRGWIAPFKLIRSNEPDDYFWKSNTHTWYGGKVILHHPKYEYGPGGIGAYTKLSTSDMSIIITPKNGEGYAFNKVLLYRGTKALEQVPKDTKTFDYRSGQSTIASSLIIDTIYSSRLTDTLNLKSMRYDRESNRLIPTSQYHNVYYGANLTNGQPGILYHAIGVNGAMFVNYTKDQYVQQLATLHPQLLIISLGTNESFGLHFYEQEFAGQAAQFIHLVHKYMPNTSVLLTSPTECYKRVRDKHRRRIYVQNTNSEKVAHALQTVATTENTAYWNLFAATGGKGSSEDWYNEGLMDSRRIHFHIEGYKLQGYLLYQAIINSYKSYKLRHINVYESRPIKFK